MHNNRHYHAYEMVAKSPRKAKTDMANNELPNENLIEEAEALAGCRFDDPNNPNAMYALFGSVARAMGKNGHGPRDDIAAGMLIAHSLSPEGQQQEAAGRMLGAMLSAGMAPDTLGNTLGAKKGGKQ